MLETERIDYHNIVDERVNRDGDMDMGKTSGILYISKLGWMNPSSYQALVWVAVQESAKPPEALSRATGQRMKEG